jgi:hypothetical protein
MSMPISQTDTGGVSPMGHELRSDADGSTRDEILALFDELAAQASHALRKPLTRDEFEQNSALLEAAALAGEVVDGYWRRHHRPR